MPHRTFSVDFSRPLDSLIPPPWLHVLPRPISHFLGYRQRLNRKPEVGNVVLAFWSFLGVFCGIAVLEGVSQYVKVFREKGVPLVVASFGAAAILTFTSITSPLAQPRRALLSQTVCTTLAIAITKLFALHPAFFPTEATAVAHPNAIQWLPGAVTCGAASFVMVITDSVHPPAGATALVAATNPEIKELGWWLLPIVVLSVVLMTALGCIFGNFPLDMEWSDRRWPLYWWKGEGRDLDCERKTPDYAEGDEESGVGRKAEEVKGTLGHVESSAESQCTLRGVEKGHVVIVPGKVSVAEGLELTQDEMHFLEGLSQRIGAEEEKRSNETGAVFRAWEFEG